MFNIVPYVLHNLHTFVTFKRLNGVAVEDGAGCEENNEIRLLFNADGSGELAKDCGNGAGEESEEPTPIVSCPENTSEDVQGGLATTLTDTAKGKVLNCYCIEVDTKYTNGTCETLPASCTSNADCNRGDYCEITSLGSNKCTKDTHGMRGNCRNAHNDIQPPKAGTNPPFVMSNRNMMWWTANHFCQALGKTLVDVSDYQCAHTICPSGCDVDLGYCYAEKSSDVTQNTADTASNIIVEMNKAYGNNWGWTRTDSDNNLCDSYSVLFGKKYIAPYGRVNYGNGYFYAVCK